MRTSELILDLFAAYVVGVAHEDAVRAQYAAAERGEQVEPYRGNAGARTLGRFVGETAWMQFDNSGVLRA